MYCKNCGQIGHIYRKCNLPVTSYGCILKKKNEILMINRKDSLCYIDILRGKYSFDNLTNIRLLLSRITRDEYHQLKNSEFDELWRKLWNIPTHKNIQKERNYEKSREQFNKLRVHSILNIDETKLYKEPEWEFPKGRRNKHESDFDCAKRELKEETNIKDGDFIIDREETIIEDIFGENNIPYRCIFYVGICTNSDNICINVNNYEQISEIRNIQWFNKSMALSKLRDYQKTKRKIILELF